VLFSNLHLPALGNISATYFNKKVIFAKQNILHPSAWQYMIPIKNLHHHIQKAVTKSAFPKTK
jgi:hypothetical protein